jgi:exodeoxyribonuclease VII large subunit
VDLAAAGLARALPRRLERDAQRLASAAAALPRSGARHIERQADRSALMAARLTDLSPLGILARGYAVCYDEAGRRVLRSARGLTPGDRLKVRMHDGVAGCRVEDVEREDLLA